MINIRMHMISLKYCITTNSNVRLVFNNALNTILSCRVTLLLSTDYLFYYIK